MYPGEHKQKGAPAKFVIQLPFTQCTLSQVFTAPPLVPPPPDARIQPAGPIPGPTYPLGQIHSTYD